MRFKEWLNKIEETTTTASVASFKRMVIPGTVSREFLGHWANEDEFFTRKKRKRRNKKRRS